MRFSLSANMKCQGENPKSPEVRECFKRVFESTGIAFHNGLMIKVESEGGDKIAKASLILCGQICFEEAVEQAADELAQKVGSKWSPTALSPANAFALRLKTWGDESSGRVNFVQPLKRRLKTAFPEWVFDASDAEGIWFRKPLAQTADGRAVGFTRSQPRLGKAFTLEVGIQSTGASGHNISFKTNIFRLERTTQERSWVYGNQKEAEACIDIALELLRGMLPPLEAVLSRYFNPWPETIPKSVEQQGKLTAREAFQKALPVAREEFPDAQLIRIFSSALSLQVRDLEGPELSYDGRLRENGIWMFHFYSPSRDISFEVNVPCVGRINLSEHGDQYNNPNSRRYLTTINEDWIDSDQAFAITEKNGGFDCRTKGEIFGVCSKLHLNAQAGMVWEILYLVTDDRGRNDLEVKIDAGSGSILD